MIESLKELPIFNKIAVLLIVLGNSIPLYGVLYWDWSLFDIFYLYWFENLILGVVTIGRMLLVAGAWGIGVLVATVFKVAFFAVHYGMFTFVHGMLLFDIFYKGVEDINKTPEFLFAYPFIGIETGFLIALLGIIVVELIHALQKIYNDRQEAALPETIMFSPYRRIIVLHITIIFGGFLSEKLGTPIWALGILIGLKALYDVVSYKNSLEQFNHSTKDVS